MPLWIHAVATPVWVTSPEGRLALLNARAANLLRASPRECVGRRCFEVVAGREPGGDTFCGPECPARRAARRGDPLAPMRLRTGDGDADGQCIRVIWIPLRIDGDPGTWLVHCALEDDRTHDIEDYVQRVAARTRSSAGHTDWRDVTRRELEVLGALARDLDLPSIARTLHVSHTTVRNHVQHLLAKTDCHSIQEIVARYLLEHPRAGSRRTRSHHEDRASR